MADLADIEVLQADKETAALVVAVEEVAAAEPMPFGGGQLLSNKADLAFNM
jgi:hypothetical protein